MSKEIGWPARDLSDGAAYISRLITLIKSMFKDAPEPLVLEQDRSQQARDFSMAIVSMLLAGLKENRVQYTVCNVMKPLTSNHLHGGARMITA